MNTIINLRNIKYQVKDGEKTKDILKDISIDFEQNQIITISGPSGSGKSTLLYAIAGLIDGVKGNLSIDGTDILKCEKTQRDKIRLEKISVIFQNLNLFSFMDVEDNILMPFYIKDKNVDKRVNELMNFYLEIMNLGNIKHRAIQSLSGGEQQRVAIIRSILDSPKIILCDEPTASLDKENTHIFMQALEKIKKESTATVIIVTHDENVSKYGSSQFYMEDGNIMRRK